MTDIRENLLTRMIRVYGFEHEVTMDFARLLDESSLTDRQLTLIVEAHETAPVGFDNEE